MVELKLRAICDGVGVVLPEGMLARVQVGEGDLLQAVETKDGIMLVPLDPDVAAQVQVGRDVMHRYRDTLSALAT